MVTGKDCTGLLINSGEQVTREQALRMYTADNGWFFHEENELGSIEAGRLGDLAVLTDDYFDRQGSPRRRDQAAKIRAHGGRRPHCVRRSSLAGAGVASWAQF